ncbi:SDR family NAD(P)-dependent oxidoreductase [Hydrogenophaga sp.]|uniref:SDR family NAD(P)-dependent oxidoreductase n=1 Tax=Hydrogenophaga sp. TaxID=1904254 RepID=UPI002724191B|nr:SDR family oxidoreductase [Hydrogenophaga sp.]MDO9435358.1 SDR family oxidoreductase [Hydrogenophaga sp.]
MNRNLLQNQSIVITGAAGGIGSAVAHYLAQLGAKLVIADHDGAAVESLADVLRTQGCATTACATDVTSWSACGELVERCVAEHGGINGLVNLAGIMYLARPWEETSGERARRLLEVNLLGTYQMGVHALTHMQRQGHGAIVNVSSGTQAGMASGGAYAASKGGVASLTYAWAMDGAAHGIRVNAISPVATTAMSQVTDAYLRQQGMLADNRPTVDPMCNAPTVAFLLSPLSSRLNGQVFRVHDKQLQLMSHPAVSLPVMEDDAWDAERIAEAVEHHFGEALPPLGVHGVEARYAPLANALQVPR